MYVTRLTGVLIACALACSAADDAVFWKLHRQGDGLLWQGRYQEAEPVVRSALAEGTRLGGDGTEMAVALNSLGYLYSRTGNCDQARSSLLRSVNIWKALGARGTEGVIATGSTLVSVYIDCGAQATAVAFWKRTLEPLFPRFSQNDVVYAALAAITGGVDLIRRDYAHADRVLTEALTIWIEKKLPESDQLALILNNRAIARTHLLRNEEASSDLEQAIRLLEASYPGGTGLVNAVVNLGTLRERQQRLTEAESLFRRALDLYATRPELAYANVTASAVARHYAALLRKSGRKADAKVVERQAVSMSKSGAIRGLLQTIDVAEMPIK